MQHDIKLLVIACNTASALALPMLTTLLPTLPIIGVIEPGAEAAVKASTHGKLAVLATESTVRSGAFVKALHARAPTATVTMLACNLLVALAEEGWCEGPEAEAILRRYLATLEGSFDTLVLGCTHFPLLASAIRDVIGPTPALIDSAITTAQAVKKYLTEKHLGHPTPHTGSSRFLVTDSPERFERLAHRFLKRTIQADLTVFNHPASPAPLPKA